jgi:hypothetical protein
MKKHTIVAAFAICLPFMAGAAAAQVAERPQSLGPFERLRTPRFVSAAEATFMKDDDRVMGVSADGIAKAYLVPVVAWHHIVFDQLRTGPILVTW